MAIESCYEFQVFQLTTLLLRGPVEEMLKFSLSLDRVTISRRAIECATCCIQNYVPNFLFIQRYFSTDNGVSKLLSAVNVASSICEDSLHDPRI